MCGFREASAQPPLGAALTAPTDPGQHAGLAALLPRALGDVLTLRLQPSLSRQPRAIKGAQLLRVCLRLLKRSRGSFRSAIPDLFETGPFSVHTEKNHIILVVHRRQSMATQRGLPASYATVTEVETTWKQRTFFFLSNQTKLILFLVSPTHS